MSTIVLMIACFFLGMLVEKKRAESRNAKKKVTKVAVPPPPAPVKTEAPKATLKAKPRVVKGPGWEKSLPKDPPAPPPMKHGGIAPRPPMFRGIPINIGRN